ncbi:family helicase/ATPase-like protein [Xylogone sp. PMI_703]|nr:family helicase/ATPase-like protein [Xylogone sp. PMI_703]
MAFDSPAVKRQKTTEGYNSTTNSGNGFDSDADDGDELFDGYIPDTPAKTWQTQPTQIITQPTQIVDRSTHPFPHPPSDDPVIQVPASSPFTERSVETSRSTSNAFNRSSPPPIRNLAASMAPAGTAYRPPLGIKKKPAPAKTVINLDDDDDDGPIYCGSSDDDGVIRGDIKPSTFTPRSASNSFGGLHVNDDGQAKSTNPRFQSILQGAVYKPEEKGKSSLPRKQAMQTRPERAKPIYDITEDDIEDKKLRDNVDRLRKLYPSVTMFAAREALIACKGSLDDAASRLAESETISDDELNYLAPRQPTTEKKTEPQMKRVLNAPIASIRDKYSSTQATQRPVEKATPPRPKRKLMKGRRHPSSPVLPPEDSPVKQSTPIELTEDETEDSGIASASEEDPELEDRVLKYLNTCTVEDLVELTNITKAVAETMLDARPFKSLDAARRVSNAKQLKSGKKSARAPIGEKIVDSTTDMFSGYDAVDALVAKCGELSKPLAEEMSKWGLDVFGAAKTGELEIVSFEDDNESLRDSGIGSPSSATNSANEDNDDEVKVAVRRKKATSDLLKKPRIMATDLELKDYQIVGLNWLALLYRYKLSCILADEMGLGKTCQVITFLSHLAETGNSGPHLVIVPGSTLENWLREFQRFSPELVVEPYYGLQKDRGEMADRILENRSEINVVVTTYDTAAKKDDNKFMRQLKPDVCVYDEGHLLKNPNSQRYQGLVKIPARFRLLLTGTPLQNNLQELAALLAFILPSIFKEREEDLNFIFKHKATTRDADHAALLSAQRIARARSMLTPFVLRRKKAQVLKHLPPKTCRVQYCELHQAQKQIYNGHLDQARERARLRIEGGKVPKSDENNPLMQLRKAAIHPLLFRRHFTDAKIEKMADILRKKDPVNFPSSHKREHLVAEMQSGSDFWLHQWCIDYPCIASFDIPDLAWMDSGKVAALTDLVKGYKENGDRVLIFSQFSLVLDILEAVLNSSLISFTRIDGSTKIDERQTLIDNFREDESITAFLLTTKAGGTGINLMCANKVIIFDSSFNPQDDRQAENRAHRVGQTREVEVVRLVTKDTIEEQIYALGQSKLVLDGRVAGDEEDSAKGEEEGEKAVSKALLEGVTGGATETTEKEKEDAAKVGEKKAEESKEPKQTKEKKSTKKSQSSSQPKQRSSILSMLTQPKKAIEIDSDDE